MHRVVLLHPGEMGASLGAALVAAGHQAVWVAAGRSAATRRRAGEAGLTEAPSLESALAGASVVLAVCPPEFARSLARQVLDAGYAGIYVDGNAIAPATARAIGELAGAGYVDGGIIGPPARRAGATRFYLSGARAPEVAGLFSGTLVDARVIEGGMAAASALKMCYAAYTKGSAALLLAVRALAEDAGVGAALLAEWGISQPGLEERSKATAAATSAKAWRFAGEMREISATFAAASLPSGFHEAAAEVYSRMSEFKDAPAELDAVIAALLRS